MSRLSSFASILQFLYSQLRARCKVFTHPTFHFLSPADTLCSAQCDQICPAEFKVRGSFSSRWDLFWDYNITPLPSHVNECFQWSKSIIYRSTSSDLLCRVSLIRKCANAATTEAELYFVFSHICTVYLRVIDCFLHSGGKQPITGWRETSANPRGAA